jgi:hypothetical protein
LVTTLQSLCRQITRILDENSVLFWNFGPRSELAEETAEPSAVIPWHEGILSTILPNNRTIADLLRENAKLLSVDEELHRVAEAFLAQEASYRTFIDKPNVAHARFPFPTDFDQRVRELGAGDDV